MSTFAIVVRWCATCQDDAMFEQPGCADDHGRDCPEWTCVGCGEAVLVDFPPAEQAPAARPDSHVA